jgi:hypothetical protein
VTPIFEVGDHTLPKSRQTTAWFSLQVPESLEAYLEWSAMPPPSFQKKLHTVTIFGGTTFKSDSQGVIERIVVRAKDPNSFAKVQQQLQTKQRLLKQRQNPLQSLWITSQAPVGEHPGVRRSSFSITDRTLTSGCSAQLYYQQEQAETGYTTTEKKPIKRNARVMLSMATVAKTGGVGAPNYIAALDFAVSREGTLAQLPDTVNLKPLKAGSSGSQNASLDEISRLEHSVRSLGDEIFQIKKDIVGLEQTRDMKNNISTDPVVNLLYHRSQGGALILTGDKASLSHAGQSFERIGRTKNREP